MLKTLPLGSVAETPGLLAKVISVASKGISGEAPITGSVVMAISDAVEVREATTVLTCTCVAPVGALISSPLKLFPRMFFRLVPDASMVTFPGNIVFIGLAELKSNPASRARAAFLDKNRCPLGDVVSS